MKVVLEFDGTNVDRFDKAICEFDDNFTLTDSIIWELDYGKGESVHRTKFGDITIKQQA